MPSAVAPILLARSLMGFSLDSIGIVRSREAKRFYSYALSDPKDEPFACLRYYCLAHGMQINSLRLLTWTANMCLQKS